MLTAWPVPRQGAGAFPAQSWTPSGMCTVLQLGRSEKGSCSKPDGVVAFLGGRGTTDMANTAEVAGVPVYRAW